MKRKSMLGVGMILAASITVVSSVVFANETKALEGLPTEVSAESVREMAKGTSEMFKFSGANSYDELVAGGIISQETADRMQAFLENDMPQREEKIEEKRELEFVDIYSKMVNAGILTQEESDAINAFYLEQAEAFQKADVEERSTRYVSEGILTQEEANAVKDYLLSQSTGMGHMAATTVSANVSTDVELDDIYIFEETIPSENADSHVFGSNGVVEEGIVTTEQFEAMMTSDRNAAESQRVAELTKALDTLVAEGTLTQEKADKTLEYLNNQERPVGVMKESIQSTDQEGGVGKSEVGKAAITIQAFDFYEGLVTDGILTQEELDAFRLVMPGYRVSFGAASSVIEE